MRFAHSAISMFWRTLSSGKIEGTWNLRPMPFRAAMNGRVLPSETPRQLISPAPSGSRPVSTLSADVLPAPFGPMIQWMPVREMEKLKPFRICTGPILTPTVSNRRSGAARCSFPVSITGAMPAPRISLPPPNRDIAAENSPLMPPGIFSTTRMNTSATATSQ